jgi:hypothetical protein
MSTPQPRPAKVATARDPWWKFESTSNQARARLAISEHGETRFALTVVCALLTFICILFAILAALHDAAIFAAIALAAAGAFFGLGQFALRSRRTRR